MQHIKLASCFQDEDLLSFLRPRSGRQHARQILECDSRSLWSVWARCCKPKCRLGLSQEVRSGGVRPRQDHKKPWTIVTNCKRVVDRFQSRTCIGDHEPGPPEGSKMQATDHYPAEFANLVIEALYPQRYHKCVPNVSVASALITCNFARKERPSDPQALEAVEKEAQGLRANGTWDDSTVTTLQELRQTARARAQAASFESLSS